MYVDARQASGYELKLMDRLYRFTKLSREGSGLRLKTILHSEAEQKRTIVENLQAQLREKARKQRKHDIIKATKGNLTQARGRSQLR